MARDASRVAQRARAPDVLDRQSEHRERLRKIETRFPLDLASRAKVRNFKEFVLQWLYRRAGGIHPTQGLAHGGAWLWNREKLEVSGQLAQDVFDFSAQVGMTPHLVRARGKNGNWYSVGPQGQLIGLLGYPEGMDSGVTLVDTPGLAPLEVIDGPPQPPERWYFRVDPGQDGQSPYGADTQRTLLSVQMPGGRGRFQGAIPGTGKTAYSHQGSDTHLGLGRWSRRLIPQSSAGSVWLHPGYNPWGKSVSDASGHRILDELNEGAWGLNLEYTYNEFTHIISTAAGWRYWGVPFPAQEAGPEGSYKWGYFAFPYLRPQDAPYRTRYDPAGTDVEYTFYPSSGGYTSLGRFQTVLCYDHLWEGEPSLAVYGAIDSVGAPDPTPLRTRGHTIPAHNVCQQLLDVAFAQAGTALTGWLHSKWQEWRAGNGPLPGSDKGQRTRRRENLWVRTTNYELRGLAQRLRREGWVYLRGTLHVFNTSPTDWKDTMPIVVVPPDCYPPAELTLFALASGGAKPPAPCRVTISVEGYLRAVKDQPDRTHLRLDGLSWQHV